MNDKLLFLEPVFQPRIWGGRALEEKFGYNIPAGNIGECWGISAHPNGESVVKNGIYAGKKLSELWRDSPEIFGAQQDGVFPLLVKVLDANADLSVQVHPNDDYAKKHEHGELGKTECWYVVDCDENAEIIFGHHAKSKEEAIEMINQDQWDQFLRREPVKKGDFFYVPSGTIHALCKGTTILEVQQSSDTTYRLYDYNRLDDALKPRELHIQKSLDVSTIPHVSVNPAPLTVIETSELSGIELVSNEFFTVSKYKVHGAINHQLKKPTYALISVIEGAGKIAGQPVKKGDHIIVPSTSTELELDGIFEMIVAQP